MGSSRGFCEKGRERAEKHDCVLPIWQGPVSLAEFPQTFEQVRPVPREGLEFGGG